MQRRVWGASQPVTSPDLTDVGLMSELAVEQLALAVGSGILSGLQVMPTPTASASVAVSGGVALMFDPAVNRPRLVTLTQQQTVGFSGKASGLYAIVASPVETPADNRTILPPPPGNPFYDAALQPYQLDTVRAWTVTLTPQAMPYTPVGAQKILATVNWSGNTVTAGDITMMMTAPTPQMADGSLLATKLDAAVAGFGLLRDPVNGHLSVRTDNSTLGLGSNGALLLLDGSVSDSKIGARNVNQGAALPANPGDSAPLSSVLGWFGTLIRGITGEANWNVSPVTSLREINVNATRRAVQEQVAATWTFNSSPNVPDPTQDGHATNRRWVAAQVDSATSSNNAALVNHRTAATLDHPDGSVTDAKIGKRSAGSAANIPGGLNPTGNLQDIIGWTFGAIEGVTGLPWNAPVPSTINSLHARASALEAVKQTVPDGYVSDAKIGVRTLNPVPPSGNTGSLSALLSGIANRISTIYGAGNWVDAPPTTLAELNGAVTRKGRDETVSGHWTFAQSPQTPLPQNASDAANKTYVDNTVNSVASTIATTGMGNHRAAAVLDHPDGSVTGAKLAPSAVQDRLGFLPIGPMGGTVTALSVSNGAGGLQISPGKGDTSYLALYARSSTASIRSGLIGFAGGDNHLRLHNDVVGGNINLEPGSGGSVNTTAALNVPALYSQGVVQGMAGGDTISLGGSGQYELRLSNPNKSLNILSNGGPISMGVTGNVTVSGSVTSAYFEAPGGHFNTLWLLPQHNIRTETSGKLTTIVIDAAGDAQDGIDLRAGHVTVQGQQVWHTGNLNPANLVQKGDNNPANLLAALVTVDGSGSGLDADLLDGMDSSAFARSSHTHTKAQIVDFAHGHVISDVNGLQGILDSKANNGHTHGIGDIQGLQAALDGKSANGANTLLLAGSGESNGSKAVASNDPRLSNARQPLGHTHAVGDVQGLQSALDGKSNVGHSHGVGEIQGLQSALDGKSNVGHGHSWGEIAGKPNSLAGYGINDGNVYDLSGYNPGRPLANEAVLVFVAARTVRIAAGNPGAARARTAASSQVVFTIFQEGGNIGSITFPAGSATGNISLNGDVTLNGGNMLVVMAPGNRDDTLSDVALTFAGRY